MGHWTIAELAERAAAVLASDQEVRTLDARTRNVPDPRTIRWYQTTGLIDRPSTMRGRTALYGERHLAQLVAIKRLQGRGRSLAAIQAELAGAADEVLHRLAALPAASDLREPTSTDSTPANPENRPRFWTATAAPARLGAANTAEPSTGRAFERTDSDGAGSPNSFPDGRPLHNPDGNPNGAVSPAGPLPPLGGIHGLRLAPGVVLLLEGGRTPDGDDTEALRRAAGPLLAELTSRALLEEQR